MTGRDRALGALLGLAVGDALGATLEFQSPGTFDPITDMVGGGPFALQAGEWTDDTSLALCLATSLLQRKGFDAADQMTRYVRWWKTGFMSVTGECFGIGNTTCESLLSFVVTGDPWSGKSNPGSASNGSLMRLAPVPIYYRRDGGMAVEMSGQSSRTTHGATAAVDACRYFGGLIASAVQGVPKEELLSPMYSPDGDWYGEPLAPEVRVVSEGSFKEKVPPEIKATGYAVDTLEAALWAFHKTEDFRDGALLAVNLGDDADTVGAVYGQIAGAYYGKDGIPLEWLYKLKWSVSIERMAGELYDGG